MLIIKKLFSKINQLPLAIYHLIFLVIILTNLIPHNQWFLGWDSINSELNTSLNIKRSLYASWEENYGLGTLGGHGFAAILPHSLINSFLSFILPQNLIRPIFTFICYYLGGLGIYFLIRKLLFFISDNKFINYIALISSLFYLFNLASALIFSVQLEPFIINFAALPWLFWIIIRLFSSFSQKNIILFCLINFFASTQGFIPTLFIAYMVALFLFLLTYLFSHHFSHLSLRYSSIILLLTLIINAYWFLPFTYFSITRSSQTSQSYNNLVVTTDFVEQSKKYGTFENAVLLKGPYWDSYELGEYIAASWKNHHQNPLVPLIGYVFFLLAIVGIVINFIKHKNYYFLGFTFIFIYCFSSIAISTPPFSYLNQLIKVISPTYYQAFRVPFTKLGIGTAFTTSILISLSLLYLVKIIKNINIKKIVIALFLLFIIFYNLPVFKGKFIFSKMYINLPSSYLQIIDYFKSQPDGRIADMPQSCSEGWYGYNWGYFGSGFYWYGIKQSFLSRSFDVWSQNNENYYWEISQAILRQDYQSVDQIFEKYNVNWVLYDPNLLHCRTQKVFTNKDELLNFFNNNSNYKLVKTFTSQNIFPISLYQRNTKSNSFVSISSNLSNVGPKYDYNDNDPIKSYPYISDKKTPYQQFFPFRNLFTKRNSQNNNFTIDIKDNSIIFSTKLSPQLQNYKLNQNLLIDNYLPITINIQKKSANIYEVLLDIKTPTIKLDKTIISQQPAQINLGEFKYTSSLPFQVIVNNIAINIDNKTISNVFYPNSINTIQIINNKKQIIFSWQENIADTISTFIENTNIIIPSYKQGLLDIEVPIINNSPFSSLTIESPFNNAKPQLCSNKESPPEKNKYEINESQDPKYIRIISQNTKQCFNLIVDNLSTNYSYLANIITRHNQGENLFLNVTNKNRPVGINLYLQSSKKFENEFLIIPSNIPNEIEYNFSFESKSFNEKPTINDIKSINLYVIPYYYLNNLNFSLAQIPESQNSLNLLPNSVKHPNEIFYKVILPLETSNKVIILYQSYSPEWLAFYFNGLKPVFLKNHTLINNWANGWQLPSELTSDNLKSEIYIIFWPQIFEFLGFLFLIPTFIWIFKKK